MKRHWWIVRLDRQSGYTPGICVSARYVWVRDARRGQGPAQIIGCVCHHSWTQRVRSFQEVPDA